jgi:predicted PurR-regulated permease PerM
MSDVPPPERKRTREAAALAILTGLSLLATVLLALVIWPFWKALFLAAVLASAIHPAYRRLSRRLHDRRHVAALVLTFAVTLTLVVPTILLTVSLGKQAVQAFGYVHETLHSEGFGGFVNDLPSYLRPMGERILGLFPRRQQQELSKLEGTQAAVAVGGVLQATSSVVIQTLLMLIAFYFLLTDGAELVTWICVNAPLPDAHVRGLLTEFRQVSVSVLVSSTLTAAFQAVTALVGYLLAHVEQPFFFAAITFVLAFVPTVGGGGATLAMAAFVMLAGRIKAAAFLALWAVVVVIGGEHALRPWLMANAVPIHGALIFFSLLGGLAYFGAVGLVAGPVILVFFLAVVKMARREYTPET